MQKTTKRKTNTRVRVRADKPKRIDIKQFILSRKNASRSTLSRVVDKVKYPRKRARKGTKQDRELARAQLNRAILGIGQLLVVVSIAYSTAVILIGVDSLESKIALFPQAFFALVTLFRAFSKLYK